MKRPPKREATRQQQTLLESTTYASGPMKVDREKGIIYGVKVLGNESVNGARYTEQAKQDVCRLMENGKANFDHPDRATPAANRKFGDMAGKFVGLHVKPDGVYASEMHVLTSHPQSATLFEAAERMPDKFGISINGGASHDCVPGKDGKYDVHGVAKIRSADIVGDPATTKGLFESVQTQGVTMAKKIMKTTIRGILESAGVKTKRFHVRTLMEMEGGDSAMMANAPVDVTVPDDGTGGEPDIDPDDMADEAFENLVIGAMRDDSLDLSALIERVTNILTLRDSLLTGKTPAPAASNAPPPEGGAGGKKAVAESKNEVLDAVGSLRTLMESTITTQKQELATMKAEMELSRSGREVTPERIAKLAAATNPEHRQLLLESWAPKQPAMRDIMKPPGSSVLLEEIQGGSEKVATGKEFLTALTGRSFAN